MTTLETIRAKRAEILSLADKYHVGNIRVFGSVVHNEDTESSDIDFLVTTYPGCSYFKLGGLLMDLQDMFGKKVDIVSDTTIHKFIKDRILSEAQPL
jgi:predicted nucleotidyltransferase